MQITSVQIIFNEGLEFTYTVTLVRSTVTLDNINIPVYQDKALVHLWVNREKGYW